MPRMKINRKDWRNLAYDDWRTPTVHTMIIELNAEKLGVDAYVPLRGYGFEQGVIKRSLSDYGAEALRMTIDRAFAEYRPTREYPQLTAGFLIAYMLPRILPQVLAELKRRVNEADVNNGMSADELADWL